MAGEELQVAAGEFRAQGPMPVEDLVPAPAQAAGDTTAGEEA